jgi:ankyrin repeat protein
MESTEWTSDVATIELWRVAENGDVDELATLLPHVADIDAGNEHGTTALMRAAQHGHVRMVRALLQHGADANLKRHDKFTALALAAFFGHTEVVRVLIAHGADSEAPTRGGTSPFMWATARTFGDVAGHLKVKPVEEVEPAKVVERPRPQPRAVAAPAPNVEPKAGPIVIRTLKDPPEIWDLVHEAPRDFNASSAFLNHLRSMKAGSALMALMLLALAGGVGFLLLRGVQAHSEANLVKPRVESSAAPAVVRVAPAKTPVESPAPAVTTAPVAPTVSDSAILALEPSAPTVTRKPSNRWRSNLSRPAERIGEQTAPVAVSAPPPAPPVVTEKPNVRSNPEVVAKEKTAPPLNPQLIAPAKNTQPKGKVIQWP